MHVGAETEAPAHPPAPGAPVATPGTQTT
jgi:hypothetical protein